MPYLGVKPADEFTSKDLNGEELILDADADTTITADTDDQIDIRIAGADDFSFKANTFEVQTGSNIDMNGTELILDANGNTSITADTDDQIDIKIAGADDFQFTANAFNVLSGSTLTIDSGATITNSGTATGFPSVGNNLIINPEFRVAQRGASFTLAGMTSHDYHLDRWKLAWESSLSARITITQDTSGVFAAWGSDTCMKIDCTTADASLGANDYCDISQRIEAQDLQHLEYGTAGARDITLSFLIKSPKSGTHSVLISQYDGSGRYFPANFTVTSADTAEKITIQIPGDTSGQIDNDTGVGLQVSFPFASGASRCSATAGSWTGSFGYPTTSPNLLDNTANDTYIGQVKLEVGGTATDFSQANFEDYGTTLNKCFRYLYAPVQGRGDGEPIATVMCSTTDSYWYGPLMFPVAMRAIPTLSVSNVAHFVVYVAGTSRAASAFNLAGRKSVYGIEFEISTASDTAGRAGVFWGLNAAATMYISAEL